jgi:hypothetical protein
VAWDVYKEAKPSYPNINYRAGHDDCPGFTYMNDEFFETGRLEKLVWNCTDCDEPVPDHIQTMLNMLNKFK